MSEQIDSPAIRAAVEEERRFGAIEADLKGIRLTLDTLVGKVGEQNGRVAKVETKLDVFIHDHDTSMIKQKAKEDGFKQSFSFLDKVIQRGMGVVVALGGVYVALQQFGVI